MDNLTMLDLLKRIKELEKKLEAYFNFLKIDNDLDFILKGSYILKQDISDVISGNY